MSVYLCSFPCDRSAGTETHRPKDDSIHREGMIIDIAFNTCSSLYLSLALLVYGFQALGPENRDFGTKGDTLPGKSVGMHLAGDHTAIELIGTDRPGLLSEIFAVLTSLRCNVIAAEVWTHNTHVACVVYVNDEITMSAVDDASRLSLMKEQLKHVLRGPLHGGREACTNISIGSTHVDRRLHQLMFADRDYESHGGVMDELRPVISVDLCEDKGYSVVNVKCKDRPKLLFDIVCTLTDMQFVVFHASASSDGPYAMQV